MAGVLATSSATATYARKWLSINEPNNSISMANKSFGGGQVSICDRASHIALAALLVSRHSHRFFMRSSQDVFFFFLFSSQFYVFGLVHDKKSSQVQVEERTGGGRERQGNSKNSAESSHRINNNIHLQFSESSSRADDGECASNGWICDECVCHCQCTYVSRRHRQPAENTHTHTR